VAAAEHGRRGPPSADDGGGGRARKTGATERGRRRRRPRTEGGGRARTAAVWQLPSVDNGGGGSRALKTASPPCCPRLAPPRDALILRRPGEEPPGPSIRGSRAPWVEKAGVGSAFPRWWASKFHSASTGFFYFYNSFNVFYRFNTQFFFTKLAPAP
jgi:hypothetical protein